MRVDYNVSIRLSGVIAVFSILMALIIFRNQPIIGVLSVFLIPLALFLLIKITPRDKR